MQRNVLTYIIAAVVVILVLWLVFGFFSGDDANTAVDSTGQIESTEPGLATDSADPPHAIVEED